MLTEYEIAKILLTNPYEYLTSIVRDIESAKNPKLALYSQFSHIGEVVIFFDGDPDLERFISEIGFNVEFMSMFREVSDTVYLFNKRFNNDNEDK